MRSYSSKSKLVAIDFAMEDANFRVKHGNFEKGLPTFERISKFVLAGDRITGKETS